MSWFEELFGRRPGEPVTKAPVLDIGPGETVVVEVLESRPRIVDTSMGRRAVLNVKFGEERHSLWLSRISLAEGVALVAEERGDLRGLRLRITNHGKVGRAYVYKVEVVE